jgi:hypothetical protein
MTPPRQRGSFVLVTFALGLAFVLGAAGCGGVSGKASCTVNGDCFAGYSCDTVVTQTCLRSCQASGGCLASEVCDIPSGSSDGVCRLAPGD